MATMNLGNREITAKIVYFGASGAGCNTNVERLWRLVQSKRKSPLHRFGPKERHEESWYFDFVPLVEPPIEGFSMTWRVYSLPGGIEIKAHRDEVIDGVDAVVFVVDARPDRGDTNLDHLAQLDALLKTIGVEMSATPVTIQVNHTDAADALAVADVAGELNPFNFPVVPAVAKGGEGVLETFAQATSSVLARVRDTLAGQDAITLTALYDTNHVTDDDVIRQHVENIQARAEVTPHSETVDALDRRGPVEGVTSIEIPFQPEEFIGSHPRRIAHALIEGDRIRIDLEMERMGGAEQRQLTVWLVNRPAASRPLPTAIPAAPPAHDRVFDYLPQDDKVDVREPGPDLPGVAYGILGIVGGMVIALLSVYLLGVGG